MNQQRLREDIEANLDKLPDRFIDTMFYDPSTGCMCLFGWLTNVVGGIPLEEMRADTSSTWDFVDKRYDISSGDIIQTDHIIRACGGYARAVVNSVMRLISND